MSSSSACSKSHPIRLGAAAAAAAAGVWFAHLAGSYALVPWACRLESVLPLVLVTIVGAGAAIGCIVIAARAQPDRSWRRLARSALGFDGGGSEPGDAPARSISVSGLALSLYFTLVVLLMGLIPLIIRPCS
jgi:hypothetical protein